MTSSDAETDLKPIIIIIIVLTLLIGWLKSVFVGTQIIYADLLEAIILLFADLFNNYRLDIAIADSNFICTLELTVCHETNVV